MSDIAIIGIGNPWRGDDGIGWAMIDYLCGKIDIIHFYKIRDDLTELLDLFSRYSKVFLIDACDGPCWNKQWERLDLFQHALSPDKISSSTHTLNLHQAIELANVFEQLPSQLILYAIFGKQFHQPTLSSEVAALIPLIAEEIIQEVSECMKKV